MRKLHAGFDVSKIDFEDEYLFFQSDENGLVDDGLNFYIPLYEGWKADFLEPARVLANRPDVECDLFLNYYPLKEEQLQFEAVLKGGIFDTFIYEVPIDMVSSLKQKMDLYCKKMDGKGLDACILEIIEDKKRLCLQKKNPFVFSKSLPWQRRL